MFLTFCQLFDRKFVDAVLNEWQKTMMDLPAGLRQAYELVRYLLYIYFLAVVCSCILTEILASGNSQLSSNGKVPGNQCKTYNYKVYFTIPS